MVYNFKQKCFFSAGIQSSQCSESTNNVLNGIASKTTCLTKIFLAFEDLVVGWHSIELELDFHCKPGLPSCAIKNSGIMNHGAKIYTHKIFKLFENEFLNGVATTWNEFGSEDHLCNYEVIEEGRNSKSYIVQFNELHWISITLAKNLSPWVFYVYMH